MSFLGNIFLGIASLIILYLVTSFYSRSIPGGDAGVGYAWGIIILNLAFFACMIIVALIIGWKGGSEWISASKSTRTWYAILGVMATLIYAVLCGFFKADSGTFSGPVKTLINFSYMLVPVVMILISIILLNDGIRTAVPVAVYKWPAIFLTVLSVFGLSSFIVGQLVDSAKFQAATLESQAKDEDANHIRILAAIDSCDVFKDMLNILVFTGNNQPENIQHAAVAKVKTNPDWEKELLRLLETDRCSDVFQFLSSNEVDNPSLFEEPINKGVLLQASQIRQSIRDAYQPHHLYAGQFMWEVDHVIRTVDRFQSKEINYLPAMKELRAALDEPWEFDKPNFSCKQLLDQWIKAHS